MSLVCTVDDITRNPALRDAIRVTVQQLTVEFLQQGGSKPHVVFKLNFRNSVQINDETYRACHLGVEYVGGGRHGLAGEFHIKFIDYHDASNAAHAAFQFDISQGPQLPQLSRILNLFLGRAGGPDTDDLTQFDFVQATPAGALDGCRDFITQCFIRLHRNGIVRWEAIGIVKGNLGHNPRAILPSFQFHDLIGNDYQTRTDPVAMFDRTHVTRLPLHRGTFLSGFQRIEHYRGCPLPYIAQAPGLSQYGASGGSGGDYHSQVGSSYYGESSSRQQRNSRR